jgi:hypothetical protein
MKRAANPDLFKFVEFMVNGCDPAMGEMYATAKKLGQELLNNFCSVIGQLPLYKDDECAFPKYALNLTCFLVTFPTHTPRSLRRVRLYILKSTGRICANLRCMLKRWLAPIILCK